VPFAEQAGLNQIQARIESHPARVASAAAFLDLVRSTPHVFMELAAMPEQRRLEFLNDARAALRSAETPDGVTWTYQVLSLVARK
jgi:hypothetical protein